jgi:hypothetical protein
MIAFDWPAIMIDPHDNISILDVRKNHFFFFHQFCDATKVVIIQ